jgi:hypothetical protein
MLPIKKGIIALLFSCASLNAVQPSHIAKGPIFASFCYWVTKGLGYGVPVVIGATAANGAVGLAVASKTAATVSTIASSAIQTGVTSSMMNALPVVGFSTGAAGAATLTAAQTTAAMEAIITGIPASAGAGAMYGVQMLPYGAPVVNGAMGGVAAGKAIIATIGVEAAGAAMGTITAAASGAAGYVAAVEGAATTAGAFGLLCPFTP